MVAQSLTVSELDDPAWIPHAFTRDVVTLAQVPLDRLRRAAFLDGREPFASRIKSVPRNEFVRTSRTWHTDPVRTIFHVSFCGSTLLSRLLDVDGRTVVYREPAIQIALADNLASDTRVDSLLRGVTAAFGRQRNGMVSVLKPTNWANLLLPKLAAWGMIRPVFVTMQPRDFLRAVFRGGRDRIAFTIRVAQHLGRHMRSPALLAANPGERLADPLDQAARVALLALSLQCQLMRDARTRLGLDDDCIIDSRQLFADPVEIAQVVATRFDLDISDMIRPVTADAKAPTLFFQRNSEEDANRTIEQHHSRRFDAALDWATCLDLTFTA